MLVLLLGLLAAPARAQDPVPLPAPVVVLPVPLGAPAPVYPPDALAAGLGGAVDLVLRVDATGAVVDVVPAPDAPAPFVQAAVDASRALTFTPGTRDGAPDAFDVPITVRFEPPPPPLEPAEPAEFDDAEVIEIHAAETGGPPVIAGAFEIHTEAARPVPRDSASDLLTLAPGAFLTQQGGIGHPEQVFLRGFDAREGQDVEFTVEGVPINDVGNPHGHGLAELHFIVPEAVDRLDVLEGPFLATQGDFAVAGSADYHIGLAEPGPLVKAEAGSFGTYRGVIAFRPENDHNDAFVGEVLSTDGFGDNRAGQRGSALLRETTGDDVKFTALAGAYASTYDSAGLLRADDVARGVVDRYATYDARQGGTGQRFFLSGVVESQDVHTAWRVQAFAIARRSTIRSNYTGFLLDDRRAGESPHDQRGDLLEQAFDARTYGLRAAAHRPFREGNLAGEWALGLYARVDDAEGTARRLRAQDGAAYRTELDVQLSQVNVAPWLETALDVGDRVSLRGGVRVETVSSALIDRCAAKDAWFPGAETDDVNCADEDRYGVRDPASERHASGLAAAPRLSALYKPHEDWQLTLGYGRGLRSLEASSLSDGEQAPLAGVDAAEAGAVWSHHGEVAAGRERFVVYGTRVASDLVFDEADGKNVVAGETLRGGFLVDTEQRWKGLFVRASATYTYAVYGDDVPPSYTYVNSDRQPGHRIPYVPPWVVRADVAEVWRASRAVHLSHGLGVQYVAPRPLPQSERSDPVFLVDAGTSASVGPFDVGVAVTNLIGRPYALAEYNFASYWPDASGAAFPTRVPSRQVAMGPPRAITLSVTFAPERLHLAAEADAAEAAATPPEAPSVEVP